jgi:hypothetical protein
VKTSGEKMSLGLRSTDESHSKNQHMMIWWQETLVTALASTAESKLGFDNNKEKKQTEKLHFLETGQARNQRKTESPVMCSASRTKPWSPQKKNIC